MSEPTVLLETLRIRRLHPPRCRERSALPSGRLDEQRVDRAHSHRKSADGPIPPTTHKAFLGVALNDSKAHTAHRTPPPTILLRCSKAEDAARVVAARNGRLAFAASAREKWRRRRACGTWTSAVEVGHFHHHRAIRAVRGRSAHLLSRGDPLSAVPTIKLKSHRLECLTRGYRGNQLLIFLACDRR